MKLQLDTKNVAPIWNITWQYLVNRTLIPAHIEPKL